MVRKEGGHKNELLGPIFPDSIIMVEYKTDSYLNVTRILSKVEKGGEKIRKNKICD